MENIKKLQRDTQHKVIGGVCSGLANYFGIDAVLVRLLFIIALLVFSTGFWIYLIMWIVMPDGGSTPSANHFASYNSSVEAQETPQEDKPYGSEDKRENKLEDKNDSIANKSSLVAGLILIGIGAIGLLHRFVPEFNWRTAWPILLIALGLFLILPPKKKES